MSFQSLGLSDALLRAIDKQGYTTPSPIQQKAIPHILERKDVLASAQTGTGKTAAFTLPLLQLISEEPIQKRRPLRALVLTPTRELAAQILDNVNKYSEHLDFKAAVVFGGVNQNPQIQKLHQGVDLLVATPGRLLDLYSQRALTFANIEYFVLDEADRMLDMGFVRDINKIISMMPAKRQNLMFSATFSKEIKNLANGILNNPTAVEAAPENTTAEKVTQRVIRVDQKRKTDLLSDLIIDGKWQQVLVFTRTKHGANRLSKKLDSWDIKSAAIHGDKSQNARTNALKGFKAGSIRVLVATDIAARGLDIPLLPQVVNFELPNVPEDYVHRIGRTARAGASGQAISLVSIDEVEYVQSIEKLLGKKFDSEIMEGYEPVDKPSDKPKGGGGGGRGRKPNFRKSNSGGGNKSNGSGNFRGKPKRFGGSKPNGNKKRRD